MALLFALAVLTRKVNPVRRLGSTPFWSYRAIIDGNPYLLMQNVANVGAFIPIGILLGCVFGRIKWWKVIAIGGGFSVLIEVLQFVFKLGFAEFDDILHNVLGCMIGFGMYVLTTWLIRQFSPLVTTLSK
jgi:glycopeptide antibiotics resistance protein